MPTIELLVRIQAVVEACQALDKVKKSLFYGKDYVQLAPIPGLRPDIGDLAEHEIDILHGAIGLATEAGEILEQVAVNLFDMADYDLVHLQEELGDAFWYLAILASRSAKTFSELQQQNLDKLKARYPDKFTEAAALSRDLDAERAALEAA